MLCPSVKEVKQYANCIIRPGNSFGPLLAESGLFKNSILFKKLLTGMLVPRTSYRKGHRMP